MKKKIRYGVYETNSSSCHSLVISKHKIMNFVLPKPDGDGYLHMTFGEFGWHEARYNDPITKLSYALTMVAMTHMKEFNNKEEFYELDDFKMINNIIKDKIDDCDGIEIDEEEFKDDWYGVNGYIDHQSCENYSCLQDFLNDYDVSLEDFIFNADVILITDNDNH